MAQYSHIAERHFAPTTLRLLAEKGISLTSLHAINRARFKGFDVGYLVDDNGTSHIWTLAEVQAAARGEKKDSGHV